MRRQIATAAAVAVTAAAIAAVTAAAAIAGYADPETISDPARSSGYPAIAIAGDGTATVAWTGGGVYASRAEARRVEPDGSLGPILELSQTGAEPPVDLDVSSAGSATVVWAREGIELARISPEGDPGPVVRVASGSEGRERIRPKVAVAADGTAILVWKRFRSPGSQAEAALVSPGGDVGAIVRLGGGDGISAPDIAIDDRGTATVVWRRYRERSKRRVVVGARIDSAGDLDRLGRISGPSGRNASQRLAVSPSGEATVVWRHYGGRPSVQSAQISSAGKVSRPLLLTMGSRKSPYPYFTDPAIAYGPTGGAHAAWVRNDNGDAPTARLWSAPLDRRGRARRPLPISEPGRRASAAQIAVDSAGVATLPGTASRTAMRGRRSRPDRATAWHRRPSGSASPGLPRSSPRSRSDQTISR